MDSFLSNPLGFIHLVSAVVAMFFGAWVLFVNKGDFKHKQLGYLYLAAMGVLLTTSFMIYKLNGTFGAFHWMALVSTLTLLAGMGPLLREKTELTIALHLRFMYWSVIGLYAAFFAELFFRLPPVLNKHLGIHLGIPGKWLGLLIGCVVGIGFFIFHKVKHKWLINWIKQD